MAKKRLYVDLDGVLVDFESGVNKLSHDMKKRFEGHYDNIPNIFSTMEPMPGGIEAFRELSEVYDTYILSTAPWENNSAWSDKIEWVKKYLSPHVDKRLIITHHKNFLIGDILIDDRLKNGAMAFEGELILFGSDEFPDWDAVLKHLIPTAEKK